MIFCYKFRTFAEFWNFCLAKYRGRLIHGYSKTCIFWLKNRGSTYTQIRLIHRKIRYERTAILVLFSIKIIIKRITVIIPITLVVQ